MGRIFNVIVTALCCTVFLATAVSAKPMKKEVYLKDGGIIECQNVWLAEGKVKVLVNRDTLLDLSNDEVDMQRTFPKKAVKRVKPAAKKKIKRHRHSIAAATHQSPVQNAPAPADAAKTPEVKPSPAVKPAAPVNIPAKAAPVAPAAGTPAPAPSGAPASAPKAPDSAAAKPQPPNPPMVKPTPPPPPVDIVKPAPAAIIASALTKEEVMGNALYVLLLTLIMIVSMCKLFAKAGQAWWKALIPIYSLFVFVSIAGKPSWWVVLLMIPLVNFIIYFMINISLARRFGQGALYGFGLALVGFIFFPLLAFGKSEYE